MLQQTQVARVVPRWHAFLKRFPTVAACAAAPVGEVIRMWDGLGYNRRAVALHAAARAMGDQVPDDLDVLLALPGVGPYTARAVMAFAFEHAITLLDVNTARPLVRAFGARSQGDADRLVPRGRAWEWNQALMDLGATVCTRRDPDCEACPLAPGCAWRGRGADPAAPAGRRSRFEGSSRQGRGRLVAALRRAPVPLDRVAEVAGWPDDPARAATVVDQLVADGLVIVGDELLRLP